MNFAIKASRILASFGETHFMAAGSTSEKRVTINTALSHHTHNIKSKHLRLQNQPTGGKYKFFRDTCMVVVLVGGLKMTPKIQKTLNHMYGGSPILMTEYTLKTFFLASVEILGKHENIHVSRKKLLFSSCESALSFASVHTKI